jgi:redox-sensitive bicupin YhaK (pirin superfamily)
MITLRRCRDRQHDQRETTEIWHTFFSEDEMGILARRFGILESLDEERLPPRTSGQRCRRDGDAVTYVREGALAVVSSLGHAGVIHAGEFQRSTAAGHAEHRETNASDTEGAHVFQMVLQGSAVASLASREQKRFCVAERRDRLCIIASPDARHGSLRLHQDACIYSAVLHAGRHVVHALPSDRSAWIHVVQGEVSFQGNVLATGDGLGVYAEQAVTLTAQAESEILLLDLGRRQRHRPSGNGGGR